MDKAEAMRTVSETGWLSRRPAGFRDVFLEPCRLRRFEAGSTVSNAADSPGGMYGLVTGQLLLRMPPAGTVVSVATPGFWAGDAAAFRQDLRMTSLTALTSVHVLHLPQAAFERLISDAECCRHIAINTAECLGEAMHVVANLTQPDAEVRVAQRLLTFVGLYGRPGRTTLALAQSEFATMCGLSRQTVSKVLARLAERGIVSVGYRRLDILDVQALTVLATEDPRVWR
jgi:CRP/FNR family transcriptional regulator, cyclic AMP receptor protein